MIPPRFRAKNKSVNESIMNNCILNRIFLTKHAMCVSGKFSLEQWIKNSNSNIDFCSLIPGKGGGVALKIGYVLPKPIIKLEN